MNDVTNIQSNVTASYWKGCTFEVSKMGKITTRTMIKKISTANKYNTIPHHNFDAQAERNLMNDVNLKFESAKEKMISILQGLNQLLVIMYP